MSRARVFLCALFLAASVATAEAGELSSTQIGGTEPVPRPGESGQTMLITRFIAAESDFAAGRNEKALKGFLDIAYSSPDGERKGFVWMRVGELLMERGEYDKALEAADKAILLSRARFIVLCAMNLKLRIYQKMNWSEEVRQVAGYLVDQNYVNAYIPTLLVQMARADAKSGKIAGSLALYRKAIEAASGTEEAYVLSNERESVIEEATEIAPLYEAVLQSEDDPEVRSHLLLALGRIAIRNGFHGMARYSFQRVVGTGGKWAREAEDFLYMADQIFSGRPKIIGLVPLTGKFGDLGFSVLSGAEVALNSSRWYGREEVPVVRWVDTAGEPEQARAEFSFWSSDRTVIGFLGPVTGEEGRSVAAAFNSKSPPVFYLGQKTILEKPFLYGFGLSPVEEARAVFGFLSQEKETDILMLHPDNGYGKGFAEAAIKVASETGTRIVQTISYSPDVRDFTSVIRSAVGNTKFQQQSRSKEKRKGMKLPIDRIVVADRWDRVFLLASQLRYYNVYLPLAGFSGWHSEELLQKAGNAVSGAVISVDYSDAIHSSIGEQFRKEFIEAMHSVPTRFEAMGYDSAQLMTEAFFTDGGRERNAGESMRERIPRVRSYSGVTGTFMFGASGNMRRIVPLLRVNLGNFVPVQAN
ncbi:MAG: ABC transporter substrate-binding protein [Syntrophorhabdaceae bacterium]|nr:ABC transporter substrate-binding protein [Syntrophorhabdaceae bacterium]